MGEKKFIKGSELEPGMRVRRLVDGKFPGQLMIVFEDGPYYKNPLYRDDVFEVLSESAV